MTVKCAICGVNGGTFHRLFKLPMALRDLGLDGTWAAARCVNDAAEAQRRAALREGRAQSTFQRNRARARMESLR